MRLTCYLVSIASRRQTIAGPDKWPSRMVEVDGSQNFNARQGSLYLAGWSSHVIPAVSAGLDRPTGRAVAHACGESYLTSSIGNRGRSLNNPHLETIISILTHPSLHAGIPEKISPIHKTWCALLRKDGKPSIETNAGYNSRPRTRRASRPCSMYAPFPPPWKRPSKPWRTNTVLSRPRGKLPRLSRKVRME